MIVLMLNDASLHTRVDFPNNRFAFDIHIIHLYGQITFHRHLLARKTQTPFLDGGGVVLFGELPVDNRVDEGDHEGTKLCTEHRGIDAQLIGSNTTGVFVTNKIGPQSFGDLDVLLHVFQNRGGAVEQRMGGWNQTWCLQHVIVFSIKEGVVVAFGDLDRSFCCL